MKNYISVNARGVNKSSLKNVYEHNVDRLQKGNKIDYLLKDKDSLGFSSKLVDNGLFKPLNSYSELNNKLNILEQERLNIISKRENKGDYLKNHLVEFVVSLSEEQANIYLDNNQNLDLGIEQFIKDLEQKYNIKSLAYSQHFDEGHIENDKVKRNLHYHLVAYNYDLQQEKSILSNFTKQDFRDLQDLASSSFKKVGLEFERGISKKITKKEHLEKNDFIIQKQKVELQELQKTRKEEYYLSKSVKNEIKDLRANFERDSIEFEQLTTLLNVARKEESDRADKNKVEFENAKEQRVFISNGLKSVLQKHLKSDEIGLIKKEKITKIEDKNQLFKDLINEFERMSKLDIQNLDYNNTKIFEQDLIEKNKKLEQRVDNLKYKNETLQNDYNVLVKQQESFIDKFKDFKVKFETLEQENKKFKDFISKNDLGKIFENFKEINNKEDKKLHLAFRD